MDEPRQAELKVDGEMVPKGEDLRQMIDIYQNFGEDSDLVEGLWLPF